LKVLQLINRFDFGGAENHVRELCNELAHQNINVFLATEYGRQKALLNQRVNFIKTSMLTRTMLIPQVISIAYTVIKYRIDVINAHQRLPIISACLAGFLLRVPVVATVHGRVRHDLRSFLARRMTSKIVFVSKRVLTVSKHYKQLYGKSLIIPNGIPLSNRNPKIAPLSIGYISRIDTQHTSVIERLTLAVESLKNDYPDITLTIYGDGKKLSKVVEMANEINNPIGSPTIYVKGYSNFMDEELLPELIVGAGRVAIEAILQGISVLSVTPKRMGDIITPTNYRWHAENNFININGEPSTINVLYSKIKDHIKNRQYYRNCSAELQNSAAGDFGITKTTTHLVELYSTLLYEIPEPMNNKKA